MEPAARKAAIRRLALSRRSRLAPEEREAKAAAIAERALALPEVAGARRVLGFASIRSEVSTAPLLGALFGAGVEVLLPYITEEGTMRAAAISSAEDVAPGFMGILEPRDRTPVAVDEVDVVLTPGVAFDATGARIGYGGGFYDAFLADAPTPFRIGVCFDLQVVEAIPAEPHDERVDVVVSEQRVIRCPARSRG